MPNNIGITEILLIIAGIMMLVIIIGIVIAIFKIESHTRNIEYQNEQIQEELKRIRQATQMNVNITSQAQYQKNNADNGY